MCIRDRPNTLFPHCLDEARRRYSAQKVQGGLGANAWNMLDQVGENFIVQLFDKTVELLPVFLDDMVCPQFNFFPHLEHGGIHHSYLIPNVTDKNDDSGIQSAIYGPPNQCNHRSPPPELPRDRPP